MKGAAALDAELLSTLRELIAALDRRVPNLERAGEPEIAADAQRLRASAVRRIEQLEP